MTMVTKDLIEQWIAGDRYMSKVYPSRYGKGSFDIRYLLRDINWTPYRLVIIALYMRYADERGYRRHLPFPRIAVKRVANRMREKILKIASDPISLACVEHYYFSDGDK